MYNEHFRFSEAPFSIAPNPRYLYLSEQHREAIAHLKYGVEANGGFILLTGEVGTGKTTVCRCFLEHIPDHIQVAILLNPPLSEGELLQAICDELKIAYETDESVNQLTARLNEYLLRTHGEGRSTVLIVEEAQNLDRTVLERLRLLTNLETDKKKLLQVILIGQPELLDHIESPDMAQLAQRVIARHHLRALTVKELDAYLEHRLRVAGGALGIFPESTRLLLYRLSKGVPRIINLICDRALLGCYVQGKTTVDIKTLGRAAQEVFGEKKVLRRPLGWWNKLAWGSVVVVLLAAGVAYTVLPPQLPPPPIVENKPQSTDLVAELPRADTEVIVQEAPDAEAREVNFDTILKGDFSAWDAYKVVFEQWLIAPIPEGTTPCEYANRHGLSCWHTSAPLSVLMRTNRPAIVKLKGDSGKTQYAAVLSFDSKLIVLRAGEHTVRVSHNEFQSKWTGEHTLLWRHPPGYVDTLKPGYKGAVLPWLSARMAQVNNTAARDIGVYGPATMRRIRKLQRECGLRVDGLVGRHTVIMLNSLTEEAPLLSRSRRQLCGRKLS